MCTDDAYGIFNNHNVGTVKTNHGGKGYTHTYIYITLDTYHTQ